MDGRIEAAPTVWDRTFAGPPAPNGSEPVAATGRERGRQCDEIGLIASETIVSQSGLRTAEFEPVGRMVPRVCYRRAVNRPDRSAVVAPEHGAEMFVLCA